MQATATPSTFKAQCLTVKTTPRFLFFILFFISYLGGFAQAPQGISYQAVVRNSSGAIMANRPVGIQFIIHDSTPDGRALFIQRDTVIPNNIGLINVVIGGGITYSGSFTSIDWAHNAKFVEVDMDMDGGINYLPMGTSQMMSVPYALYAATSGSSTPGPAGATGATGATGAAGATGATGATGSPTPNDSLWALNGNNIYNTNGGNVGIGTSTPASALTVNGYSMLGTDGPAIKMKEFNGNMPNNGGDSTTINTMIPYSKVLAVQVLVQDPVNGLLAPLLGSLGLEYNYSYKNSIFTLSTTLLNSAAILGKPYTVLVTYKQ